jgi:hypothetical protein
MSGPATNQQSAVTMGAGGWVSDEIPSLKTLRTEANAWNRRMNRDRVKIEWKFDRNSARRKFGYNLSCGHGPGAEVRLCCRAGQWRYAGVVDRKREGI